MEKSLINTYKTNKNIDRNIDRNIGIDILRFIAAFGVICIHQPFEGEFGQYFKALSRFSVPIFFMITGYFYNQTVKNGKENKQIVKIIKLCIISNLLYFLYDIIIIIYKNGNIASYFQNTFNFKSISKLILFNESPFGYHLWYLNALLYVLIIAKIVNKHDKYKWMYLITPVLLLLNLIIGKYSLITIKRDISFIYVRNFLLLGIPYFFIGSYINNKFSNGKIFIKKKYLVVFVLIFCMSTIIERTILVNNSVNGAIDYYLSTIFLSISIFIICLRYNMNSNNRLLLVISEFGKKYSIGIYIFHPIIRTILSKFNIYGIYRSFAPIWILLITLIICIIYKLLKKYILNFVQSRWSLENNN